MKKSKQKIIIVTVAILVIIIGILGYKVYSHFAYEKNYNAAIEFIVNDEFDKGRELLEPYSNDGIGYKDTFAWYGLCYAWEKYEANEISIAVAKSEYLKFNYATASQRSYIKNKQEIIKKAWDDYVSEQDRKLYNGEVTVTHRYTTTKHYTTKSHTSKHYTEKYDPYGAKDYLDADDFYEDYYDDFDDYEDAVDYYDDHDD